MKGSDVNLRFATLLLLACIFQLTGCVPLVVGGAAAGGYYLGKDPRTVGEIADDTAITAKVKTRLFEARDIKSLDIDVDTFLKVVTLKGTVRSRGQENRVINLAKGVTGVKKVVSKLQILRIPVEDQSTQGRSA